jgi:hypothetical protein
MPPIAMGRGSLSYGGNAFGNCLSVAVKPYFNTMAKKGVVNGRLVKTKEILVEHGYEGTFVTDSITAVNLRMFCGGDDGVEYLVVAQLTFTGVNPLGSSGVSVTIGNVQVKGGSFDLISQGFQTIPFEFRAEWASTGAVGQFSA